jgi:hypothetical protein
MKTMHIFDFYNVIFYIYDRMEFNGILCLYLISRISYIISTIYIYNIIEL